MRFGDFWCGGDNRTGELFSYADLEARVRRDHPLRAILTIVKEALSALEREFLVAHCKLHVSARPYVACIIDFGCGGNCHGRKRTVVVIKAVSKMVFRRSR